MTAWRPPDEAPLVPWPRIAESLRLPQLGPNPHKLSPRIPEEPRRAAVGVILWGDASGARKLVLVQRGFGAPSHPGEIAFPGGMVEAQDRDLPATARREVAEEIGLDGTIGRRCGLLHDIGKAADHEMEGGHPSVGAELLRRYGEGKEVVHAALGHHDDLRLDAPYTVLVAAADAISASRPGARRETLEKYVRRLEELESLALGFPGVEQAYAIQAGREVRIIVDSQQLDDASSAALCRDIAKAIQAQLTYPGEVKVTVLRESRSVEYAR